MASLIATISKVTRRALVVNVVTRLTYKHHTYTVYSYAVCFIREKYTAKAEAATMQCYKGQQEAFRYGPILSTVWR
jgi:hypothetical protein